MAHLTLQLGASVAVPFRAPQGMIAGCCTRARARRLRWKALREAAAVGEGADAVFCAIRRPQPHVGVPFTLRDTAPALEGVSQ